jgi:hypothetical protein
MWLHQGGRPHRERRKVYAISHRQLRREPPRLVIDQSVQRGTKTRDARLTSRKNDEAYVLHLTADILAAVDWHVGGSAQEDLARSSRVNEACQLRSTAHENASRDDRHVNVWSTATDEHFEASY